MRDLLDAISSDNDHSLPVAALLLMAKGTIAALLTAPFLKQAARWTMGMVVPYKHAFGTCLMALVLSAPLVLGGAAMLRRMGHGDWVPGVSVGIGFVVLTLVTGSRMKKGFGTSLWTVVVTLALEVGVGAALWAIVQLLLKSTGTSL